MFLCSRLLFSNKYCLRCENARRKQGKKSHKMSDPSTAGRGEEKAAWTVYQTDEGELRVEDPQCFFNYLSLNCP